MARFAVELAAGGSYVEGGDYLESNPTTHALTVEASMAVLVDVPVLRLSHPLEVEALVGVAVDAAALHGTIPLSVEMLVAVATDIPTLRLSHPLSVEATIAVEVATRLNPVAPELRLGPNGIIVVIPKLYRADRFGNPIEDLSEWVDGGSVAVNLDADVSGTLRVRLRDRDRERPASQWVGSRLAPYTDWLLVTVLRRDAGGHEEEEPVGLYTVDIPGQEVWPTVTYLDITGHDPTWALAQDRIGEAFTATAGQNHIQVAAGILAAAAIALPPPRVPPSDKTLPADTTWNAGTDRLTIANDMYEGAGYYPLKADTRGQLYSMPFLVLADAQARAIYDSEPGSLVIPPVSLSPTTTRVRNHIVVTRADSKSAVIRVEREAPVTSPVAIAKIGMRLSRYVSDPHLADIGAATAMADRLIEEGATYYQRAKLQTVPGDVPDTRDVVELRLADPDGYAIPGVHGERFWRSGWSLPLKAGARMTSDLNRLAGVGTS